MPDQRRGPTRALHDRDKRALAKALRREGTEAEDAAWELLRAKRLDGLKFRRQQIVCGFIADFFCATEHLIVEIDGDVHDDEEQLLRDRRRDEALLEAGYRTIRIKNADVTTTLVERIRHR